MNNLKLKYNKLNNSFNKIYIYHLGGHDGFFSEYNNMILAMLYCLKSKIRFVLYSKTANFGFQDGWDDYFQPFCEERKCKIHRIFNYKRSNSKLRTSPVLKAFYKLLFRINYTTFDLWKYYRNRDFEKEHFYIPELDIDGDIIQACKILIDITWNYNPECQKLIDHLKISLNLPPNYLGFHIRCGDKVIESDLFGVEVYLQKAILISNRKDAFVLTDDYRIIETLENNHPEWNLYTLCGKEERGYYYDDLQKNTIESKKKAHLNLFASIDILSHSEMFIGTFSSNPGMYLGMRMLPGKSFGIDLEKWQIW